MNPISYEGEGLSWSGSGAMEGNSSLTSTCAVRSLQAANGTILPLPVAVSARVFQILYCCLQGVLGIFLNILIIFLILKFKKLQTTSSAIAIQLAIANLMLTVTYHIPSVLNHIVGRWILDLEFCILAGAILLMLTSLRTLLIFSFSLDRFALVFAPFFYPKYSRLITLSMCTMAWTISVVIGLVNIPPIFDCYIFSEPIMFCTFSSRCGGSCRIIQMLFFTVLLLPSQGISVGFFLALYLKGRKIRRIETKMLGLTRRRMTDQDWRALRTFLMLFVAVFMVTFPPNIFIGIINMYGRVVRTLAVQLASDIVALLVVTDPIIIMRNADFKEAFNTWIKPLKDFFRVAFKRRQNNATKEENVGHLNME